MPSKDQVLGDFYYKEAKRGGYRSRSALKLKEIAEKYRIFRKGQVVVDWVPPPVGGCRSSARWWVPRVLSSAWT